MDITNYAGVSLPLAVWLAADGYDFAPGQSRSISATGIMKPVRQILLRERLTEETAIKPDVSDFIASRLGHTIHDGIEKAWTNDYRSSMRKLGYPEKLVQRTVVNPTELKEGMLPVYIEQRHSREIRGYKLSGKFDMILEGEVNDFKSTSAYAAIHGSKDEDYKIQGSIYRWINPEKATADFMTIHFIFTDWQKALARSSAASGGTYPQSRLQSKRFELMSLDETEAWLNNKIDALEAAADLDEPDLPYCTDEELWRSDAVWKYFSDATKANIKGSRSSKNFDNPIDARAHQASKGGKGAILHVPGQVKACAYCPAFPICTQKDLYDHG